jgi:hypothetical protein
VREAWPSRIRNFPPPLPQSGADRRKFSYPTVISIDTEQLPSVESGRAAEFTTGELGTLLARADEDEDDQQHDQQNRCELRGNGSANEP